MDKAWTRYGHAVPPAYLPAWKAAPAQPFQTFRLSQPIQPVSRSAGQPTQLDGLRCHSRGIRSHYLRCRLHTCRLTQLEGSGVTPQGVDLPAEPPLPHVPYGGRVCCVNWPARGVPPNSAVGPPPVLGPAYPQL